MNLHHMRCLFLITTALISSLESYSQYRDDHPPVELRKCEGDTFTILNFTYINHKIKVFHDENCTPWVEYNEPNIESVVVSGGNQVPGPFIKVEEVQGDQIAYFHNLRFVATEDATIRVEHVQRVEHTDARDDCHPPVPQVETRTETFTFILKVLTRGAPTLTASRTVLRENRDSVSLSLSGCNPLYWGVQLYSPNVCSEDGPPDSMSPSPSLSLEHLGNPFTLQNSITFYARCSDNNCVSDWSGPLKIDVVPYHPTIACNDPDLEKINQISQTGRPDFHHFRVETTVCDKSDENSECNRINVLQKLLTKKIYSTPIASDFVPLTGMLGTFSVLGSHLVTPVDFGQVEDCGIVRLPAVISMMATGVALNAAREFEELEGAYKYIRNVSNEKYFNPVGQYRTGYSVVNYTKEGHILHPGKIVRTVVEDCDKVKIVTIGIGNTWIGDLGYPLLGVSLKILNELWGHILFKNIDRRFIQDYNAGIK